MIQKSNINFLIASLLSASAYAADLTVNNIEVVSQTPLPSLGIEINKLPSSVQTVKGAEIQKSKSLDISNFMNENLAGVYVNNNQGNPLQADVNYHGFTASPLLGAQQGLSVYMDGVRMNQPFGDVMSWDLIPRNAISGMQLHSGSNPLFGLNTLGGALSIQTKDGRSSPGGAMQFSTGSWGRNIGEFEYGGVTQDNSIDYFLAGTWFNEDGWRDHSKSDNKQLFGKLGWQGEKTNLKLTYAVSDSDLNGNGLTPSQLLNANYNSIYTYPDNTQNRSHLMNLQFEHLLSKNSILSGNAYYKNIKNKSTNGDINNDLEDTLHTSTSSSSGVLTWPSITHSYILPDDATGTGAYMRCNRASGLARGGEPGQKCEAYLTYNKINQESTGIFGQIDVNNKLFNLDNKFIVGGGLDRGWINYNKSVEFATLNQDRKAIGTGYYADPAGGYNLDGAADDRRVQLLGTTWTWSAFGTDTISLNDNLHLTGAARYNHISVENRDRLIPDTSNAKSLSGDHHFSRFNPAIGLAYNLLPSVNTYLNYNEGTRAPTAMELGCASPTASCKLPNAMAGDPSLKQVVSKTWEGGARGKLALLDKNFTWNVGLFNTSNYDDIQFVAASSTSGYFKNFGETQRKGFDAGFGTKLNDLSLKLNYSYINATYESSETLLSTNNSTAIGGNINVSPGKQIPLVPHETLKLSANYRIIRNLDIGANVMAFSSSYVRGNENNEDPNGKIPGYAVMNLNLDYSVNNYVSVFARVDNLFDKEYSTSGQLGSSPYDANGNMKYDHYKTYEGRYTPDFSNETFYAPGAPRAGWVGLRWEFGGTK